MSVTPDALKKGTWLPLDTGNFLFLLPVIKKLAQAEVSW